MPLCDAARTQPLCRSYLTFDTCLFALYAILARYSYYPRHYLHTFYALPHSVPAALYRTAVCADVVALPGSLVILYGSPLTLTPTAAPAAACVLPFLCRALPARDYTVLRTLPRLRAAHCYGTCRLLLYCACGARTPLLITIPPDRRTTTTRAAYHPPLVAVAYQPYCPSLFLLFLCHLVRDLCYITAPLPRIRARLDIVALQFVCCRFVMRSPPRSFALRGRICLLPAAAVRGADNVDAVMTCRSPSPSLLYFAVIMPVRSAFAVRPIS